MGGIPKFIGLVLAASRRWFANNSRQSILSVVSFAAALIPSILYAAPITIDFEALADSEVVTIQFAGLSFSNATVLTAGISLNEFEFPPRSGLNIVVDDGGAISIAFDTLAQSFSAYFTYGNSVTVKAFDGAANLLTSATSSFSSNLALSGDAGSVPNELLALSSLTGIRRVDIEGASAGGSFVMDDLRYELLGDAVPMSAPASLGLCMIGFAVMYLSRMSPAKVLLSRMG